MKGLLFAGIAVAFFVLAWLFSRLARVFSTTEQTIKDVTGEVVPLLGKGSAKRILQISLRDAGGIEEVFAFDQFGKCRAGGYARRTAVDLVADLFEDVVRDPDRKTGDIAARGVAGLAPARRIAYLTSVARPDKVVYDLLSVTIGHE